MITTEIGVQLTRDCVARAFGRVLRERRKLQGISQEELAYRTDVDRTYPSLLERGLRTPTLGVLLAFAQALDTKPEQLITETMKRLQPPVDQLR
jgi:transcriptional regulator with XRE-family HTH domain